MSSSWAVAVTMEFIVLWDQFGGGMWKNLGLWPRKSIKCSEQRFTIVVGVRTIRILGEMWKVGAQFTKRSTKTPSRTELQAIFATFWEKKQSSSIYDPPSGIARWIYVWEGIKVRKSLYTMLIPTMEERLSNMAGTMTLSASANGYYSAGTKNTLKSSHSSRGGRGPSAWQPELHQPRPN